MSNNSQINNIELKRTCFTHIKIFLILFRIINNKKQREREREFFRIFIKLYRHTILADRKLVLTRITYNKKKKKNVQ